MLDTVLVAVSTFPHILHAHAHMHARRGSSGAAGFGHRITSPTERAESARKHRMVEASALG